ncbi:MAG: peroxiredoxin [Ignavibacteriales bacterium]|jgi:peroxiredoxin Q/BCP
MLTIGKKAPSFTLLNQDGKKVSLKEFAGKQVILYFYPKDMTSGCTQEACDFRDRFDYVKTAKAVLLGVSPDSVASHKKFISKYELPFDLLSDESKEMLIKYDVWKEKSMYGRKYMGVERTTIIIDGEGKIKQIFPKVKVNGHAEEVLKALK